MAWQHGRRSATVRTVALRRQGLGMEQWPRRGRVPYFTRLSGPALSGKFDVFSTWMPACCSPLNGVTEGLACPGSQPRSNGSCGSLNQRPRWYMCVGGKVVTGPPVETENVSTLKRPTTSTWPSPWLFVSRSDWYQAMPNGLFGSSVTKRSNCALAGRPRTSMRMRSTTPSERMLTCPWALGRQEAMPAPGTMSNVAPDCWADTACDSSAAPTSATAAVRIRPERSEEKGMNLSLSLGSDCRPFDASAPNED